MNTELYQIIQERITAVQEQAARDLVRANSMLNDEVDWLKEEMLRLQTIIAKTNPYLKPGTVSFSTLSDGTPLYPAYHPLRHGESFRRAMSSWSGQTGEWVGVTLDGRLFQQSQLWGSDIPRSDRWEAFRVA